jgi:diguanylate cyclase (GGDEF)-like protein
VLLGLLTDDDVLISWRSVQKTLKTSQGDAVTELPNRVAFDQHLQAEYNRGQRCSHSLAVILIDLDFFKQINDQFGHAAGDAALKTVATTVRKNLRSYDLVARFGGDEFAVICSGCRPGEINIVIRRIRECVLQLQDDFSVPRPVPTISVGACVAHNLYKIDDPVEIIQIADEALYAAKGVGRNCAFKTELHTQSSLTPSLVRDQYTNEAVLESLVHKTVSIR